MGMPGPLRREQPGLPHQPQDAVPSDAMSEGAEPDAHLAMPFAMKRTVGVDLTHRVEERGVRVRRLRPALVRVGAVAGIDPVCA
jgi:hypothetical protein